MLKLFGASITVLAALLYSKIKNTALQRRINRCKAVTELICELKMQVECHALPLWDILEGCRSPVGRMLAYGAKKEGFPFAVRKHMDKLLDGNEEMEVLLSFADGFGRGNVDAESERCSECIDRLNAITATLEKGASTEEKTRLAVSLCVSLMAVLFLA